MKNRIKKAICVLGTVACMLGSTLPASAETIQFNVTPPGDPYSYSVKKADSEQRFYVTGTNFNKSGILRCVSGIAGQGSMSNTAYISSSSAASSAQYRIYAPSNKYYEMYTSSSTSSLNVRGRYTP